MITSDIVAIFSSPRKDGNSCTIGKAVLDGAMGMSLNTIKVHRLNSKRSIHGCQNCDRCREEGKCCVDDDLAQVLEDISRCDSLVVMVPIYFNGPCGQFKIFLDRMFSHMTADLKPRYPGKKLVMVITHDDVESDEKALLVQRQLEDVFVNNLGYEIVGVINYCCNREFDHASRDEGILNEALALGKLL